MQIVPPALGGKGADCPNLKALLADPAVTKLFHFARFDIAALLELGVLTAPVICTKIASKLVRTYTDRHGLKDLCRDLAGVELSKQQQTSDWGAVALAPEQLAYAASTCCICTRSGPGWRRCWRGKTGWRSPTRPLISYRRGPDSIFLVTMTKQDLFSH